MSGKNYTVSNSGTNSQGNHYCTRNDNDTGRHAYHYSNNDGSYYYKNSDGSKYYNSGSGYTSYTSAGGQTSTSTSGKK